MSVTIPVAAQTYDQRITALVTANKVRRDRADLKRDLKDRTVSLFDVLLDPPAFTGTMAILELVTAAPHVGTVKANRALVRCDPPLSGSKHVGSLTLRQRRELIRLLGGAK